MGEELEDIEEELVNSEWESGFGATTRWMTPLVIVEGLEWIKAMEKLVEEKRLEEEIEGKRNLIA